MKISIGAYDAGTRIVPVVFEQDGVRHERPVNACHGDAGKYDAAATVMRVEDVARGVSEKLRVGAIRASSEEVLTTTGTSD